MFSIYLVTNNINDKVYVGQTCKDLSAYFRTDLKRALKNNGDRKPHFYNAIRKYGEQSFSIKKIATADDKELADIAERFFIKLYQSNDKDHGYNIAIGGGGSFGYTRVISDEHREKIRLAGLGRIQSEETKLKRSQSMKGRTFSESHRQKISASRLGKKFGPFSNEHKQKIAEANKGHFVSEETKRKISEANKAYHINKRLGKET